MSKLDSKIVTVVDNGLFTDYALTLGPAFKKVFYWTPWQSSFPKSNSLLPGDGFDEIERVKNVWDAIEKSDLIIFPDVYFGDWQEQCVRMGKAVWGSRKGESLELDRMGAKRLMVKHGIVPSPADEVVGLEALREYLKEHENVYVKISANRGDFETFKSETYELSEPKLDELEHKLGAKKLIAKFVIEPEITDAVEWGIDTYTVDGQWPARTFAGLEIKDLGFLGRVMEWKEIPQYLRDGNEKLSPWLGKKEYRGWISNEKRIKADRTVYEIDWCCRLPSPPNEIQQMVFSNWPQIIWAGANGKMVNPMTVYQYGCCAMIHSGWADKGWQSVKFPEEIRPFVKLRNHCKIEGTDYVVPQEVGLPEIGAVIGLGQTLEESIEHLKENAAQIQGYFLEIKLDSVETALEERDKAEELGIKI